MDIRDLDRDEWVAFFEAFSRRYRGRPVTLELVGPPDRAEVRGPRRLIAGHVPLVGITAEPHVGEVRSIDIIVGHSIDDHLVHIVNAPRRVRVEQVSNGEDETLTIESATDPTVRVDFSLTPADTVDPGQVQRSAAG